jgi:hypothetical protein
VEAALASAERQIERLRGRERAHARALNEARHQLREGSCASSAVSEEACMTPEAGARPGALFVVSPGANGLPLMFICWRCSPV